MKYYKPYDLTQRNADHFAPQTTKEKLLASRPGSFFIQAVDATVPGIDVSHYQGGNINWAAVYAAGYRFGNVKSSESNWYTDPYFAANIAGAHAAGLFIGLYHFVRRNVTGVSQFNFLKPKIEMLLALTGGVMLPVMLDVETADNTSNDVGVARLEELYNLTNAFVPGRVGIYCSPYLWTSLCKKANGTYPSFSATHKGWVAYWTPGSAPPSYPTGWLAANTKIWQNGVCGDHAWCPPSVPGVPGKCDHDLFLGDYAALQAYAGWTPPPPPPPEPDPELEARVTALEAIAADLEERVAALEASEAGSEATVLMPVHLTDKLGNIVPGGVNIGYPFEYQCRWYKLGHKWALVEVYLKPGPNADPMMEYWNFVLPPGQWAPDPASMASATGVCWFKNDRSTEGNFDTYMVGAVTLGATPSGPAFKPVFHQKANSPVSGEWDGPQMKGSGFPARMFAGDTLAFAILYRTV